MILIDYNAVAIANMFAMREPATEDLMRHMILNSIRLYRKKFKQKYGEVVICCDAGGNWRKEIYPEYKANRSTGREEDNNDWEAIFGFLNMVRDELRENFPYKLLHQHGCEGDDVIAAMVHYTQEFGNHEDVIIVSTDGDFKQLQKFSNVDQYSPVQKKFIKAKNPRTYLQEHIFKGDGGDGVPNVKSPDNHFTDDLPRQSPVYQKDMDKWLAAEDLRRAMGEEFYRNYQRNKKMIDLSETPPALVEQVINSFENQVVADSSKIMPFLMKKKCRYLLEDLNDFIR